MTDVSISQLLELASSSAFSKPPQAETKSQLSRLTRREAERLRRVLWDHRLQYLFWHALRENQLTAILPPDVADAFAADFRASVRRNAMFELALAQTSLALSSKGVEMMVCKGAMLAQHYYPVPGLRRMHDIDFWILDGDLAIVRATLTQLGFAERPEATRADTLNLISEAGIELDVHLEMKFFAARNLALKELCVEQPGRPYRVLKPEALVAHLLVHMLGHAPETGIMLCWLIDLALVLRKQQIDPQLLRELLPDEGFWDAFLRLFKTFRELGWVEQSLGLDGELAQRRSISWASLVRQRRRSRWHGLRGKARLVRAILRRSERSLYPTIGDVIYRPLDWVLEESELSVGRGALLIRRGH